MTSVSYADRIKKPSAGSNPATSSSSSSMAISTSLPSPVPQSSAEPPASFAAGSTFDTPLNAAQVVRIPQQAPPHVNVWSKRREQMVQQTHPAFPSLTQSSLPDKNSSPTVSHASNGTYPSDPSHTPPSSSVLPYTPNHPVPLNGGRKVAPPPVEDAESWPEVGKGPLVHTKMPRVAQVEEREKEEQDEKSDGTVSSGQSATGANKKGERTKWVPLPPEEWQAPTPPRQRSQPQSRNGSQHPPHRQAPRASGSGVTSASMSQVPSKAPSGRTSKASSVHSSPRRSARGRPLPPDAVGEHSDVLLRPMAPSSPRAAIEPTLAAPVPHISIDPNVYRPDFPPPPPFFAQMPPPPPHQMQSPIHPYSPSSAGPPYPPPQHFPNGFMPPPPFYPHHPGTPPYPMYSPYPYPYPPYGVYWNGAPPDPPAGQGQYMPYPPTPQAPPPQPPRMPEMTDTTDPGTEIEPSLPPPTMLTRPPPPTEVDAVLGYREVDPEASTGSSMTFGCLGTAKEARSPSPAPPARLEERRIERVARFTVGVAPGDKTLRSRTQSRHHRQTDDIVDRTDPDIRIAFGTISQPDASEEPHQPLSRANGLQLQTGAGAEENVPPGPSTSSTDTTWEVRDYGYGFGRPGAPRSMAPHESKAGDFGGRRRGGPFYPERGGGYGRRARGAGGGGYGRGGGGYGGSGRSYGRGGGRPPFAVTPPAQPFQPLPPPTSTPPPPVGLFIPPHAQPFYDAFAYGPPPPPVPAPPPPPPSAPQSAVPQSAWPQPRSQLAFALDATRFHLLGQLEYYLSPQNFAQDLFLRTKMDAKGWIPIALLASFKRVLALTQHEVVVHEVLALSHVVEVRAGHVRAGDGEWRRFVLPNAAASIVEPDIGDGAPTVEPVHVAGPSPEVDRERDQVGEEEDEVEFVMSST